MNKRLKKKGGGSRGQRGKGTRPRGKDKQVERLTEGDEFE